MITEHLLQYLLEHGFGTALDVDLFSEVLPVGKTGIAIYSRGGDSQTQNRLSSYRFDIYSRATSNSVGKDTLEKIKLHFQDNYDNICALPIVPNISNRQYKNCRLTTMDNIENLGIDENDRVVFRLGATMYYDKE